MTTLLPKLILSAAALALFYAGYVYLFDHERVWHWDQQRLRRRGVTPADRTPAWTTNTRISGFVAVGVGLLLLVIILLLP